MPQWHRIELNPLVLCHSVRKLPLIKAWKGYGMGLALIRVEANPKGEAPKQINQE